MEYREALLKMTWRWDSISFADLGQERLGSSNARCIRCTTSMDSAGFGKMEGISISETRSKNNKNKKKSWVCPVIDSATHTYSCFTTHHPSLAEGVTRYSSNQAFSSYYIHIRSIFSTSFSTIESSTAHLYSFKHENLRHPHLTAHLPIGSASTGALPVYTLIEAAFSYYTQQILSAKPTLYAA